MDEFDNPPPIQQIVPAATAVIFRKGPAGGAPELLMVQRTREMRFAANAAVFPGGRVDPADRVLAAALAPDADAELAAARIAAIRETLEETGLAVSLRAPVAAEEAVAARALLIEQGELAAVLDRFGWQLDLDSLVPFARWCPRELERPFDTFFFLADLGTGEVDITVDATENSRLFWLSAAEALHRAETGELLVIFPTRRNLERLAQFASFAEARAHAEAIPVRMISPTAQLRDGERWLTIPEGLGYPVTSEPLSRAMRG